MQAFPAVITINDTAANTFSSAGTLSEGVPVVPQVDLTRGNVALPAGAGVTTYREEYIRGTITSYNVTLQRLLPHSMSVQVGYVANRQNDITRNENLNYGQIGGGAASQPYRAIMGTTSAVNVRSPLGRVKYRLAAAEREPSDDQRAPGRRQLCLRERDGLVGRRDCDTRVPGI